MHCNRGCQHPPKSPWREFRLSIRAFLNFSLSFSAPAACSFPGENARSWGALGEARPGQSSLSAGALRYRQGYKSGRAGRGLGDHTVHTLASQMGNPRPREGRQLPKAAQLHRDRAGLGSMTSWSGVCLEASPYRPTQSRPLCSRSPIERQFF